MPILSGGRRESGLDRALGGVPEHELDEVLLSGELWPGELEEFPRGPTPPATHASVPWQFDVDGHRDPPAPDIALLDDVRSGLGALISTRGRAPATEEADATPPSPTATVVGASPPSRKRATRGRSRSYAEAHAREMTGRSAAAQAFAFDDDRIGIVVIHGIGPQPAGQTLLDWTRPIIELLADWREINRSRLEVGRYLRDPVLKANIDFSGETFPIVQVTVPALKGVPSGTIGADQRRWVFTEAWWAQEVRAPNLQTMIGWLGEQGGVARIVDGITRHTFGEGLLAFIAKVSLGAFVSVIVSFVLFAYLVLLTIVKLVPIGPLRDAVVIQLASSFLTDWFGGARTLLRDPAQSANVRGRLVAAIKALRAYGCRDVVVVAHSGGTMVSWMTLTDPAWPTLRVQKLVTIGEALNLAWRLENTQPDAWCRPTATSMRERFGSMIEGVRRMRIEEPCAPKLPAGHRMLGDLARLQPTLLWRDFWATHDPAPAGRPQLPDGVDDPGGGRFTEEKVWNRMSVQEDHGGYWDNDEHFVLPLVRELDVPSGSRCASRFYDDQSESRIRNRRKERVGLLALWRRLTFALPVMALLAAATLTFPGIVPDAGRTVIAIEQAVPGHAFLDDIGRWIASAGSDEIVGTLRWTDVYTWGRAVFQVIFVLLVGVALSPSRVGPLWEGRGILRLLFTVVDVAVGLGIFVGLVFAWLLTFATGVVDDRRIGTAVNDVLLSSGLGATVVVLAGLYIQGRVAPVVLRWIRERQGKRRSTDRVIRVTLISVAAVVLSLFLVGLVLAVAGMAMVAAGNRAVPDSDQTRHFVLGVGLVLGVATVVARVGTWRWGVWDRRERRASRRQPLQDPSRAWVYMQAVLLSLPFVLAGVVIAFGTPHWTWLLGNRFAWLAAIAALVVVSAMLGVARDVIDNDADSRVTSADDDESSTIVPPTPGAAPASA